MEPANWVRCLQVFLDKTALALIRCLTKDGILQKPSTCIVVPQALALSTVASTGKATTAAAPRSPA